MAYYWLTPPSRAVFFISLAARGSRTPGALRPRRHPRGQQSQFRDIVDRLPAALGRQLVQRLLAVVTGLSQPERVSVTAGPAILMLAASIIAARFCALPNACRRKSFAAPP
jgi:hypothetical protein